MLKRLTCFAAVKLHPQRFVSEPGLRNDPYVPCTNWWDQLMTHDVYAIRVCFKSLKKREMSY